MPAKTTRRLSSAELAADEFVIIALRSLDNYEAVPGLPSHSNLEAINDSVISKQAVAQTAQIKAATARDAAIAAEWERHDVVIRTKALVLAKYGRDSDEVKAIGLKRQIDRKRSTRRNNSTP